MNLKIQTKIEKLQEEHTKNADKITHLKARNKEIAHQIKALKSTEILGLVSSYDMTPEQLAALLAEIKGKPAPGKEPAREND